MHSEKENKAEMIPNMSSEPTTNHKSVSKGSQSIKTIVTGVKTKSSGVTNNNYQGAVSASEEKNILSKQVNTTTN